MKYNTDVMTKTIVKSALDAGMKNGFYMALLEVKKLTQSTNGTCSAKDILNTLTSVYQKEFPIEYPGQEWNQN